MNDEDIAAYQEAAQRNYEDAPVGSQSEAAWMQNALLAEVAIQMAILNVQLGSIRDALYSISTSLTIR